MGQYISTKVIELGSSAFRQWRASHSHCQYVHGYQLKAKFWFGCSELDDKNWAADFGGLKELKAHFHNTFDHKLLIASDDPCLDEFILLEKKGAVQLSIFENGVGIERAAEYCFNIASEFIKDKYGERVWVERVEVFEHEDNSAIYSVPSAGDEPVIHHTLLQEVVAPAAPVIRDRSAPLYCKTDKSLADILAGR
jgi:6-pyruvoyltetrahydropterin/6-carboxytetrahydropterin synthase